MANLDDLQKSQKKLQQQIDTMISALDRDVNSAGSQLANSVLTDFMNKLNTLDGLIINDAQNMRLVSIIDGIYDKFNKKENLRVIASMADNINTINALNSDHFESMYAQSIKPTQKQIEASVNNRFGINPDGSLVRDGYMMGLLDDTTIRNNIKQMAYRAVQGATGWAEFAEQMKVYIEGNKDTAGAFNRFYRNYAFDVYSQADRLNSSQYATKLGLDYAIYEGGLIKTSRKFCIEKNGQVFTRDEIMKFKLTEAAPPDYDPITDLGGYGCRHYLNWISEDLAFMLRPELKAMAKAKAAANKPPPAAKPLQEPTTPEAPTKKVPKAGKAPVAGSENKPGKEPVPDLKTVNQLKEWVSDHTSYAKTAEFAKDVETDKVVNERVNSQMKELDRIYNKYDLRKIDRLSIVKLADGDNAQYNSPDGIDFNALEINTSYLKNPLAKINYKSVTKSIEKLLASKKFSPSLYDPKTAVGQKNNKILADMEERAKYKRWSISNEKQDTTLTLTHEMGHKIHNEYFGMGGNRASLNGKLSAPEIKALTDGLEQLYRTSKSNGDIYKISEYGSINEREFFTESFVLYEKYPKELPDKIKMFIDKVLSYAKR